MSAIPSPDPSAVLASRSADLLPDSEADPPSTNPLPERAAERWLYRSRTTALLRCYLRFSIEVGRLPSILGRELFGNNIRDTHEQTAYLCKVWHNFLFRMLF